MLFYQRFFKKYGNRKIEHLNSPVINKLEEFILPGESVYHYIPSDEDGGGISTSHWALKDNDGRVYVEHVVELAKDAQEGNPRKSSIKPDKAIRDYHIRYRKTRLVRDLQKSIRNPKNPLIINYALLPLVYIYPKSMYAVYYKSENFIKTIVSNLKNIGETARERNQFITIELPDLIPALNELKRVEEEIPNTFLSTYSDTDTLMILHIWRWLGETRNKSALDVLDQEILEKTNFIFKKANRWLIINLGLFNNWRDGVINEGSIDPRALQKRFLKMLITLFESVTISNVDFDKDQVKEEENVGEELEDTFEPVNKQDVKKVLKQTDSDEKLEEELNALNRIEEEKKVEEKKNIFEEPEADSETSIQNNLEALAQSGEISASEFKRYQKFTKTHEEIKNPYTGKGSLIDLTNIDPQVLEIKEPETFKDKLSVTDKSMLKSTVGDFDKKYVSNVMQKDIVSSVMGLTKAGVPITDYEVEQKEDISGSYEEHVIRVSPFNGKRSTLTFKIPKVSEDGTFTTNGITYRLRKQRGDLPIRKTSSSRVALTSYYGKLFVQRSPKVVHDYGKWLTRQIRKIGLDKEDNRVINLKNNSKFDLSIKLPRTYTTIGIEFNSFESNDVKFIFDYPNRQENFKIDKLSSVEKSSTIVVGKNKTNFITMDDEGTLYELVNNDLKPLGSLESFIQLDTSKAPLELAEIKVLGTNIPIGFLLSYYMGIDRLLNSLGIKYKKVPTGEKIVLNNEEFKIVFLDETLVISKSDMLNTLILNGFNTYKKAISQHSFYDFNKTDIYLSILENYGMNIKQIREFDLLKEMFVDDITLGILKELKQPTTWLGILKYATELLLTDQTLGETDLREMRIKGYERIAGAVYGELVNSMRGFKSNQGYGNKSIELHPFAVWKKIDSDPAVVITERSNPIKNIMEKEAITYMGVGGRSRDSMVGRTRVFTESDMGTISEATVDSGDVAINTYSSANPKFNNLRGMTDRYDPKETGAASLLSTPTLLSPSSDRDDGKRVNN